MGTWSVPWEDDEQLEAFLARMDDPWMAVVSRQEVPDTGPGQAGDVHRAGPDGPLTLYRRSGFLRRWKRVPPIGTTPVWDAEAPGLYGLLGDDELFDTLTEEAEARQAEFDVRPLVRERLRAILEEFGAELGAPEDRSRLERLRAAMGLPPLP